MARPKKEFTNKDRQKKHEAALARRRERRHEAKTLELATQAAEGEADFTALVDAERTRILQIDEAKQRGGSKSPKNVAAARENLSKAFDLMGGVAGLVVWGRQNPTEFYRIWARLIPKESVEVSAQLPLEDLLSKLASKEGLSVADAAFELGTEMLDEARKQVELEDAFGPGPDTIN